MKKKENQDFMAAWLEGKNLTEFAWCLHCQKAQLMSEVIKNDHYCTMPDCNGGGIMVDIMPWSVDDWPRSEHPEYPEKPEVGKKYPLY